MIDDINQIWMEEVKTKITETSTSLAISVFSAEQPQSVVVFQDLQE